MTDKEAYVRFVVAILKQKKTKNYLDAHHDATELVRRMRSERFDDGFNDGTITIMGELPCCAKKQT